MTPRSKSLLEGTTKGPWVAALANDTGPGWVVRGLGASIGYSSECAVGMLSEADARLIAAAPTLAKENEELRAFYETIWDAYDKSREQSKHPFFAGQRLRRLCREALERAEAILEREG